MRRAPENPRVVERAAADAHARAARRFEHVLGCDRRGDVAVADDGDRPHRGDHRADAGEVHRAGKALGARPSVHEDRGHADVLEHAREVRCGQVVVVPAEPHLRGHGNPHRLDHAPHQRRGLGQFGHHRGPAADFDHFFHRAAHVDIDRFRADFLAENRRVAHFLRHAAEELDGQRPVLARGRHQPERRRIALQQRTGVHQIRRSPRQATEFPHGQAHGQIGVSGKRRQKEVRGKFVGAESHAAHSEAATVVAGKFPGGPGFRARPPLGEFPTENPGVSGFAGGVADVYFYSALQRSVDNKTVRSVVGRPAAGLIIFPPFRCIYSTSRIPRTTLS